MDVGNRGLQVCRSAHGIALRRSLSARGSFGALQVEVEVEVPWQWPAESSGPLQVARVLQVRGCTSCWWCGAMQAEGLRSAAIAAVLD